MADVGGLERAETSVTLGELLDERLRLTQPWHRIWRGRRRAHGWIARINSVLADVAPSDAVAVGAGSTLTELPQRERAIALATIALAEGTPVVVLNQLDTFAKSEDETAFLSAVCRLAPASTTLVVGTPIAVRSASAVTSGVRPVTTIDFTSLDARGVLK